MLTINPFEMDGVDSPDLSMRAKVRSCKSPRQIADLVNSITAESEMREFVVAYSESCQSRHIAETNIVNTGDYFGIAKDKRIMFKRCLHLIGLEECEHRSGGQV